MSNVPRIPARGVGILRLRRDSATLRHVYAQDDTYLVHSGYPRFAAFENSMVRAIPAPSFT
jgi:hypothetical protein